MYLPSSAARARTDYHAAKSIAEAETFTVSVSYSGVPGEEFRTAAMFSGGWTSYDAGYSSPASRWARPSVPGQRSPAR